MLWCDFWESFEVVSLLELSEESFGKKYVKINVLLVGKRVFSGGYG